MKLTIKLFLVIIIAASTITADDGNMGNGGRTCTINCPAPPPETQNTGSTETQTSSQTSSDGSILTVLDDYLKSLFG